MQLLHSRFNLKLSCRHKPLNHFIMLSKNYISILASFCTGAILLTTACKKNDDAASISPATEQNQPAMPTTESYTVTSHDGHLIGINGKKSGGINPKQNVNTTMGCGSAGD